MANAGSRIGSKPRVDAKGLVEPLSGDEVRRE